MKVNIVGNGCTWVRELSTSYIIDDQILFDTPQGSFKTLSLDYDLEKVNYIILSHFHSDHFADIHLVLETIFKKCPNKKLTIIAPEGAKEKICQLFRVFEVAYLEEYLKERADFITLENLKKFNLGSYKFKSFKMLHNNIDSYGLIIEKDGVKVGFSGDSAMCNNVRKILKASKVCFIDSANIDINNKHLSVNEVNQLEKEFPECKLYRVHLASHSMEALNDIGIDYPKQGSTIYIV